MMVSESLVLCFLLRGYVLLSSCVLRDMFSCFTSLLSPATYNIACLFPCSWLSLSSQLHWLPSEEPCILKVANVTFKIQVKLQCIGCFQNFKLQHSLAHPKQSAKSIKLPALAAYDCQIKLFLILFLIQPF